MVKAIESQYPRIKIDVEQQLSYYQQVRPLLLPLIADTIDYTNSAFDDGKKILVEGA
jgi:adenylosuccinate synthase